METKAQEKNPTIKHEYGKITQEINYEVSTSNIYKKSWVPLKPYLTENIPQKSKEVLYLWITTFVANLTSFGCGVSFSWTSPVLPILSSADSPLGRPTTAAENNWIVTMMSLGAMIGPLLAGRVADLLGRKKTLILLTIPMLMAFILLAFATEVYVFYLARNGFRNQEQLNFRLLHGLSVGTIVPLSSLYVAEISEPTNRGKLICTGSIIGTTGIFYPLLVGPHLSIKLFSLSCAAPLIIFFVIFPLFMPESPYHLISVDKKDQAEEVLKKLRNCNKNNVSLEIIEMSETIENDKKNKGSIKDIYKVPGLRRSLIISGGLVILSQFSGINPVRSYLHTIFEETGSILSPNVSSVIIGCLKLVATIIATVLIEKLGRKILLLGSCLGCAVSLTILGIYFFLEKHGFDLKVMWWLPIASMVVYIVSFNVGLGPVSWTVVSEVFPSNIKSVATSLTSSFCFLAQAVITICYSFVASALGLAECFWMFGGLCFLGIIFIWVVVPETKGKSLGEIQKLLNRRNSE